MLGFLIGVILFGILMAGATFAFMTSEARENVNFASANRFKVDVDTTGAIEGPITFAVNKESGLSSRVKIRMNSESVLSKANLYFQITNISNNKLSDGSYWNKALRWELYGKNESGVWGQLDNGTFMECSTTGQKRCVNGDKLYMLTNLQLTYEFQEFDVYVWLDGNVADNGVRDAYIKATVSAETEEFSADLD